MSFNGTRSTPGTPVAERLRSRRHITEDGCWTFTGCLNNGYGFLTVEGRGRYAHRLAWETWVGPIPEGLELDHLCRNRACFNPAHLEPVTPQINNRRGMAPGAKALRAGACNRGHDREVWGVVTGPRTYCRLCRLAYLREYNELRKADLPLVVDTDAIFKSRRHMQRLGLLDISPEDILDNTPGRVLASYRYPSLNKEDAA